jgi:sigma-B regulation protein RsbU (phosphoserine phosphatase)
LSEGGRNSDDAPPTEDLEDLYENAPCGYLSIRPDGRIFKVNATFATWIGSSSDQLVGKRFQELLNIAGRIFFETHFAPLLRMQGFFNEVALDLVTHAGAPLPVLVNARERRDADGGHLFTRLTVFNATDRRRYERELVDARAAAEAANKEVQALHGRLQSILLNERATSALREQFIAVLGHDLRNPLAAIDCGMQLLQRAALDDRSKMVVEMVRGSVGRMVGLIENIMDFARGRLGGGLTLDRNADQPIEPELQQVAAELRASSPGRTIDIHFAITVPVYGDRRRIGQLTANLIGNAITHGAVDQPIRVQAFTADGVFELSVANAGEPIPAALMDKIFEPFARGEHRASLQGLGLGLYISHSIATAHGGTLEVTSTPEETRFTFRMPLI